jgi:hypothetical protein
LRAAADSNARIISVDLTVSASQVTSTWQKLSAPQTKWLLQARLNMAKEEPQAPQPLPRSAQEALRELVERCAASKTAHVAPEQDIAHVSELFGSLMPAQLPCHDCRRAAGIPMNAYSQDAASLEHGFVALLKLQAAWHTWCLKQEHFLYIACACKRMKRWCRGHKCVVGRLVAGHELQVQSLCRALHGFSICVDVRVA